MAIALEGANLVWQRVTNATLNASQTDTQGRAPIVGRKAQPGPSAATARIFKDLKWWLATQYGNPKLQFLPFSTSDELVLANFACTVYAIFAKKQNTDTDSYLQFVDSATDASTLSTKCFTVLPYVNKNDENLVVFPYGFPAGIGIVIDANTAGTGTSDSTAADTAQGFVIIGGASTNN